MNFWRAVNSAGLHAATAAIVVMAVGALLERYNAPVKIAYPAGLIVMAVLYWVEKIPVRKEK